MGPMWPHDRCCQRRAEIPVSEPFPTATVAAAAAAARTCMDMRMGGLDGLVRTFVHIQLHAAAAAVLLCGA
jgi:hypothetical protein